MKIIKLFAMLSCVTLLTGCVDQSGGAAEEETRIVATSIATCEILDKLDVDSVVGIPDTQAYEVPERYKDVKTVGSPMAPNMEIVKSLNPTIVLSPNSLEGELKPQYDGIGTDSYFLNLKSVDGMYDSIRDLGKMFGKEENAEKIYSEYEQFKKDYTAVHADEESPRVLVLMGLPGSFVVATESSYVGSLLKMAGAENVYGDGDGQDFLNVNTEDMLEKAPDMIFRTSHAMPEMVQKMFADEFETNDIWKHFDAVKNGQVYDLSNELFGMSATFRYPEALEHLQSVLYGK